MKGSVKGFLFGMADAYVYMTWGGNTMVAPCLSFSSGWTRNSDLRSKSTDQRGLKLATLAQPTLWSVADVREWLLAEGFSRELATAFEEAGIDGQAVLEMNAEEIASFMTNAKMGDRIKLRSRIMRVAHFNNDFDESKVEPSDLCIMLHQSSVTVMALHALLSGRGVDEVAIVYFQRNGRDGYGHRVHKMPPGFRQQPFYVQQMRNAKVVSLHESASNENPTISISLACVPTEVQIHHRGIKDLANLGPALSGLNCGIADIARAEELAVSSLLSAVLQ